MSLYPSILRSRRRLIAELAGVGAAAAIAPVAAAPAPSSLAFSNLTPDENLKLFGRLLASFEAPSIGAYSGLMYGKAPGKRALPLFRYVGFGVMQCRWSDDGRLVHRSRECGFFSDLKTGEILEHWDNPYTGKRDRVYHFYNDLVVNSYGSRIEYVQTPKTEVRMDDGTVFSRADGVIPFAMPFRSYGPDDVTMELDFTMQESNPVTAAGWPSYSSGPVVSPSEHFMVFASRAELQDPSVDSVKWRAGFTRISEAWPFMRMNDAKFPGFVVMGRQSSMKGLKGYDVIDRKTLAYVEKHAPAFLELPKDVWKSDNLRANTWRAFVVDVPPENPQHPWRWRTEKPGYQAPTGLGSDFAR